jgi:hypothetical protein
MLDLLVAAMLAADSSACLPVPEAIAREGAEAARAYQEASAKTAEQALKDSKTPRWTAVPKEARPLLGLIWSKRDDAKALRNVMEKQFIWSFGGDPDADQALVEWTEHPTLLARLPAALSGSCKREGTALTCSAKGSPRLVLELKDRCWRWTAFVEGD